jgi:hypothetical protein
MSVLLKADCVLESRLLQVRHKKLNSNSNCRRLHAESVLISWAPQEKKHALAIWDCVKFFLIFILKITLAKYGQMHIP